MVKIGFCMLKLEQKISVLISALSLQTDTNMGMEEPYITMVVFKGNHEETIFLLPILIDKITNIPSMIL